MILPLLLVLSQLLVLSAFSVGCEQQPEKEGAANFKGRNLTMVTTTSTENTGLLEAILPDFKEAFSCDVKVIAVGSGAAFEMAKKGEADVILVHAPKSEEQFMSEGFGRERSPFMYNDFVLIGPGEIQDLQLSGSGDSLASSDIIGALSAIQKKDFKFISRGDDSGTHKKELQLWEKAEIEPNWKNYLSVGKGMGEVISMADELLAYTLTDRATYLSMKEQTTLKILIEGNDLLYNPYAVITMDVEKFPELNHHMADGFVTWLLSEKTLGVVSEFGKAEYGQPLFYLFE